ncbi:MAG: hypothetical protein LBT27_06705 [Prevotellaceae bacterium]|jgi:hypothetical protein|nr:hypothetical protein [Prevotellaceae bacterium]
MKNELIKRNFNIASFETLESSGEMLNGGFSTAYAGGASDDLLASVNFAKQCGCSVFNRVAGCGCQAQS